MKNVGALASYLPGPAIFIERLPGVDLFDIAQTWRVFQGVTSSKGLRWTRFNRKKSCGTTRTIVVYGGMNSIAQYLADGVLSGKPNDVIDDIWNHADPHADSSETCWSRPLSTIHHLQRTRLPLRSHRPRRRSLNTQIEFVEQQKLWETAAFSVMQRKSILRSAYQNFPKIETWIRQILTERDDPAFYIRGWD